MLSFYEFIYRESDAGPVVGSHHNDSIMQSHGIASKYAAKEGTDKYKSDKADCNFLGKCKNIKHTRKYPKGSK